MDEDPDMEAAGISLLVDGICRMAIRIYPASNSYPLPRLGFSAWALLTFGLVLCWGQWREVALCRTSGSIPASLY